MPPEVFTRRTTLVAGAALAASPAFAAPVYDTAGQTSLGAGARFGWWRLDLGSGARTGVNSTLRLPMCSSFKWLLAACVLWRVDAGRERLDTQVSFGPGDINAYAPTARAALSAAGGGEAQMSVAAMCEAAVELSDNTAADLLLARVGGPAGLTAWLRAHGDGVTRCDRTEPALNLAPLGEVRDTTTAQAMVGNLKRFLYGPTLQPASRARLMHWMLGCKTGEHRLRAGLAPGWRLAHKTGTNDLGRVTPDGSGGEAGDVGVLIPPRGAPVLIAVYVAGSRRPEADVDAFFAMLARTTIADVTSYRSVRRG